jgi:hypothetical protein
MEACMWKAALVGAFALATIGISGVSAQDFDGNNVVVTESHIARFKAALRLTAAQERHWPAVEAALRGLAKRRAQDDGNSGTLYRLSSKAAGIVVDAVGFRRVAAAAGPLLRSLDEEQKQSALQAASAMGFSNLASAF